MKFFSFMDNFFDRLCAVLGAFIGSQIPQFMHQYAQRLAGNVDALQKLINQLNQIASLSHRTVEQYIQKFKESGDPDFIQQGVFMQEIIKRWEDLYQALQNLTLSSPWLRPYYFMKDFQAEVAHSTFTSFQLGFNITIEGFCYAGAGMIVGWAIYKAISKCITLGYRRVEAIYQ